MKKYRWLYFLIFSFFIGVFFTLLVYVGIWQQFAKGIDTVKWWGWILYAFLAFYITLTLHELGHFLAFYVQGIKLRAIYLTVFVFYKTEKGWRFAIKPKLWILFGGLVVPDLELIEDEKTYEDVSHKFAKSLIVAPYVTIAVLSLSVLIFVLSLIFSSNFNWIGFISAFAIYVVLLSSLYIYTFKLSNQMFYGDFVAYKKIKADEVFRFVQLNQYMSFRLDQEHLFSSFMWEKSKDLLKSHKMRHDMIYTMLMMSYLEGILYENKQADEVIDQMISKLPITMYVRSEHGLMMAYDVALYHYQQKRVKKAYDLLNLIEKKQSVKIEEKSRIYLNKKAKHVMHITYDQAFLDQKENFPSEQSWIFEPIIDVYKNMAQLHKPLPFVIYDSPVEIFEKTDQENKKSE